MKSNKRKNRIAQLRARKNLRRNISRTLLQSLAWIGFIVIYYTIFSILFDTPYEAYLRHSSKMLREEYTALESRYDSLNMVLDNIQERDQALFRTLFESSPYKTEMEIEDELLNTYSETIGRSTNELVQMLQSREKSLQQRSQELVYSTQNMVLAIERKGTATAKIPAIQPIANQQLTLLTASYGMRIHPFYKTLQPHLGVDYTIPEGKRVFATANGTIKSYSLSSSTSGKSVLIDHGNGYETYYAHLDKIDIPRSRYVRRGDIIGMSGNTGLSLTPHLHYEIRYKGEKIDPINYFFMELDANDYQEIKSIAQTGMQAFD